MLEMQREASLNKAHRFKAKWMAQAFTSFMSAERGRKPFPILPRDSLT